MNAAKSALCTLAAVTLVMVSCAPAAVPPPAATTAPTQREAADSKPAASPVATPKPSAPIESGPRSGGVLTISSIGDPITFDMHQEISYLVSNVVQLAYSGLMQYNPESPAEGMGDLATTWDVSKDGLTYTFRLNPNVKFHDGSVLSADDASFSFERMINPPKGTLAPRRGDLATIDKVEAPDKSSVKFTLKYPSASFLDVISSGWMVVFSRAFVEKKGHMKNDIMGTGPYKLKTYSAGVSLDYVKNPDYFVKGRPYLDGITFYIIKDAGTRLAAFRTRASDQGDLGSHWAAR